MIRFRPLWGLTIATVLCIALLAGLGVWQLHREKWKLGLIAAVAERSHKPPVPAMSLLGKPDKDIAYTHAKAKGQFLNNDEAYLFKEIHDQRIGYDVLTPLKLDDGRILLVDRGFVPMAMKDPATRKAGQLTGEVEVTGLIRGAEKPGWFTPKPDLKNRVWYILDLPQIEKTLGLKLSAPFVLAAAKLPVPGGYPQGGHTRVTFRNEHLQYAVTWFGVAWALFIIYFAYHASRGRFVVPLLGIGVKAEKEGQASNALSEHPRERGGRV